MTNMPRKTTRPVVLVCVGCEKARYAHQMATFAVRKNGVQETRLATWCRSCGNRKRRTQHAALRATIAVAQQALLLEAWDGAQTKRCRTCKQDRPEVMFAYYQARWGVAQRQVCVDCAGRPKTKGHTTRMVLEAPYDRALVLVEARSGKGVEQWGRREHEAHCLLMREDAGVPHLRMDVSAVRGERYIAIPPKEITRWEKRSQMTHRWLGSLSPMASKAV